MFSRKNNVALVLLSVVSCVSAPVLSDTAAVYAQISPVYDGIKAEAANCDQPGNIGYAIKQAQQVHTKLASARPNTESLFDVGNDCFSGLTKLLDLSFAIPSLASILSAAQSALISFAQKKICSAVSQATSMVTTPINNAISDVNGLQGFTDLNGMSDTLIQSGMQGVDPQLGASYSGSTASTYTLNTEPFSATQVTFSTQQAPQAPQAQQTPQASQVPEAPPAPEENSVLNSLLNLFN